MKNVWLYCLALFSMSFAFVSPAQAMAGWQGLAPVADYAAPVDIGEGSTACLAVCTMPQLEAAVILASKSITRSNDGTPGDYRSIAAPAAGPFEHGWRS